MSKHAPQLPARPSLEQLRKLAKERLTTLRADDRAAKLADAQFIVAREHGFESWPQLVAHVAALDPRASEPRITSPVSRSIAAMDVARSARFWQEVLGFQVRGSSEDAFTIDLVSGRARIRLVQRDPSRATVFLETDDVVAMHTAIRQRGGEPGSLENVNWIKMRVFEIRDPDGHVIWFGQSYHVDSLPRPRAMMRVIMPELPLDDVPAGVRHYRDVLGFSVNYEQHDIGVMDRDETRLLLIARTADHTGIGSASFYVRDVDALYAELLTKGADVEGEPVSQPWGLREFSVRDLERNRLTFAQTFE
jgi:catechol 2,3-dioxygenase-like lactoylglutathione lyase family enzyme